MATWKFGVAALFSVACGTSTPAPPNAAPDGGESVEASADVADAANPMSDGVVPPIDTSLPEPCNGWPELCDRRYDQVTFPATHASATVGSPWKYPAQTKSIRAQLDENIRTLAVALFDLNGEVVVCSQDCAEGHIAHRTALGDVRAFLDDNPRQVVTLLIENHVSAAIVAGVLEMDGLSAFLRARSAATPWPTLAEMIANGQRLVVFVDDSAVAPDTFVSASSSVFATGADFHSAGDMNCDVASGDPHAPFMLVQHFLTVPVDGAHGYPRADLAEAINHNPFLIDRLAGCRAQYDRAPSFVAVDFYDASDVVAATQTLNGLGR